MLKMFKAIQEFWDYVATYVKIPSARDSPRSISEPKQKACAHRSQDLLHLNRRTIYRALSG